MAAMETKTAYYADPTEPIVDLLCKAQAQDPGLSKGAADTGEDGTHKLSNSPWSRFKDGPIRVKNCLPSFFGTKRIDVPAGLT